MAITKLRSPNYPGVGLAKAIDLVKQLYKTEKQGVFPPESSASAWGYKSYSGPVRSKFSTLKQFGLIEQKKGEPARLSERALTLVLRNEASKEYMAALKEAALEPPLFRELYEQKRFQSSDETLKHDLIVNRTFTDDGASQFIEAFRATITVAKLTEPGIMSGQEEEHKPPEKEEEPGMPPSPNPLDTSDRIVAVPLSASKWVNLRGSFPLTEREWTQMKAVLEAMKPGLVVTEEPKDG